MFWKRKQEDKMKELEITLRHLTSKQTFMRCAMEMRVAASSVVEELQKQDEDVPISKKAQ